jgi:Mrp family chromosome partitioning ATPase
MNSKMMGKLELLGRIAEMKRIYTVIESSIKENACVVVASALQGEGKSTLAAGLALAASKAKGRRVLAVDLNWYGPVLHSIFGVEEGENRKSYHDGGAIERIIRKTSVENIDSSPSWSARRRTCCSCCPTRCGRP